MSRNACYGGYVDINCGSLKIRILEEVYGRHPDEKCYPSPNNRDCSTDDDFYKRLCNRKSVCRHRGVRWQYINRTGCVDVYTNYVHLEYRCIPDPREWRNRLLSMWLKVWCIVWLRFLLGNLMLFWFYHHKNILSNVRHHHLFSSFKLYLIAIQLVKNYSKI